MPILLLSFCIIINLQYSKYSTAFILFATLGVFCFYKFVYPNKQVEKELKTDKFKNEREFTFTFYEKFFPSFALLAFPVHMHSSQK